MTAEATAAYGVTVALTVREARALAAAADMMAAISGRAFEPLECGSDKLRLALIEIGEPPS
jgi:hypothetical protein